MQALPIKGKKQFYNVITKGNLPKFTDWGDYTNGLGVAVHDTWATHIILESLTVQGNKFFATVRYHIEDHFGLDNDDLKVYPAKYLNFFKT